MKFAEPLILLYGAGALILAALCFILTERRRKRLREKLLGSAADDPRFVSLSKTKRAFRLILILAALILITLAAARPYIRYQEMPAGDPARDVMVIFDVSKSMRAADLPPSRMDQAKYLLRQVINAFPEDRFGLIPFAGKAFVCCPLTRDHHTLLQSVDLLDYNSVPIGGTNLEQALLTADKSFAASAGDHRVILLLTDGDELTGNTDKALKQLEKRHIPLIVVGFGSPDAAAPVPDENGKIMRDNDGGAVGSKLNETLLRKIALDTGGRYFRSTVGDTGFAAVKAALTDLASPRMSETENRAVPEELFGYFVFAALIALAFAAGISSRKKGKVLLLMLLPLMLTAAGDAGQSTVPESDPAALYKQALEMQKNGNADAAGIYEKLVSGADTPELIRSRAMQNLAVLRHRAARKIVEKSRQQLQAQQLDEAIKTLTGSQELFTLSKELYTGSLNTADQSADKGRVSNYNHLLRDDHAAKELLKKLQELKKQQQKAQQQTQQAQQQNKEQQKQSSEGKQQNPGKGENKQEQSGEQEQQKQSSEGKQQNPDGKQDQSEQQQTAGQSKSAADAAEKLSQQAKELGQDKLADQARSAADDLKEAEKLQQQGNYRDAAEKLEQAKEKLGKPEEKSDGKSDKEKPEEKSKNSGEAKGTSAGEIRENNQEKEARDAAGKKLELLEDEAGQLRDAIRRQQQLQRRRVNKDW